MGHWLGLPRNHLLQSSQRIIITAATLATLAYLVGGLMECFNLRCEPFVFFSFDLFRLPLLFAGLLVLGMFSTKPPQPRLRLAMVTRHQQPGLPPPVIVGDIDLEFLVAFGASRCELHHAPSLRVPLHLQQPHNQ